MSNLSPKDLSGPTTKTRGESQRLAALTPGEWMRLPLPGARDPLTGLSRSTLNELILPGPANAGRPPVKSVVLKKRGAMRGIRLVHTESLLDYLNSLADQSRLEDQERAEETGVPLEEDVNPFSEDDTKFQ